MFPQPALLLAFIAEQLRDGEPLDGLFIIAFVRGDHAGQRRRHFRPQRNGAFPLVHKVVELADDFLAALRREQFQGFQRRTVVFAEAVAAGNFAPLVKDILARVGAPHVVVRERFGIKIAESGQSFHRESIAGPAD